MTGIPELEDLAKHPNVVAIGETGLDKMAASSLAKQKELFTKHIVLAEKVRKPLIIHCVKAWQELIHMRKQYASDIPWIIHGFRGNGELAQQLLQFGFYLSFGPYFQRDAIRIAWDTHHLYAETDDSDISIMEVYQRIASQLSISCEALSQEITENMQSWHKTIMTLH